MFRELGPFLIAGMLGAPSIGDAAVLMRIEQKDAGERLEITARGSLDLTGLGAPVEMRLDRSEAPIIIPNEAWIPAGLRGDGAETYGTTAAYFGVFVDPLPSIGSGARARWWSSTRGDFTFIVGGASNALHLLPDYQSGSYFESQIEYGGWPNDWGLEAMGISEGSYRFDLVNGEHVDLVVTAVPLPAALPLALVGFGVIALIARTRRSKAA